jgi:prevent-host-death family protein
MIVATVTEAKAQLSALLERVQKGEEIVLCRNGKPIARLVPIGREPVDREPGRLRGLIRIRDDFEELPEGFSNAFGAGES